MSMPIEIESASIVRLLNVKFIYFMNAKVDMTEVGIAIADINVVFTFLKKTKTMKIARPPPKSR